MRSYPFQVLYFGNNLIILYFKVIEHKIIKFVKICKDLLVIYEGGYVNVPVGAVPTEPRRGRPEDPLKLELQAAVSCPVNIGPENQMWGLWKCREHSSLLSHISCLQNCYNFTLSPNVQKDPQRVSLMPWCYVPPRCSLKWLQPPSFSRWLWYELALPCFITVHMNFICLEQIIQ